MRTGSWTVNVSGSPRCLDMITKVATSESVARLVHGQTQMWCVQSRILSATGQESLTTTHTLRLPPFGAPLFGPPPFAPHPSSPPWTPPPGPLQPGPPSPGPLQPGPSPPFSWTAPHLDRAHMDRSIRTAPTGARRLHGLVGHRRYERILEARKSGNRHKAMLQRRRIWRLH